MCNSQTNYNRQYKYMSFIICQYSLASLSIRNNRKYQIPNYLSEAKILYWEFIVENQTNRDSKCKSNTLLDIFLLMQYLCESRKSSHDRHIKEIHIHTRQIENENKWLLHAITENIYLGAGNSLSSDEYAQAWNAELVFNAAWIGNGLEGK